VVLGVVSLVTAGFGGTRARVRLLRLRRRL